MNFRAGRVAETKDLDDNTLLDLDRNGNICAITIEHASERAEIPKFSYEQLTAYPASRLMLISVSTNAETRIDEQRKSEQTSRTHRLNWTYLFFFPDMTRRYQQEISQFPVVGWMVREFGEEEAEQLLREFRVEIR